MTALYVVVYIVGYILTGLLLVHLDRANTSDDRAGFAVIFASFWPIVLLFALPYAIFKWAAERMQ